MALLHTDSGCAQAWCLHMSVHHMCAMPEEAEESVRAGCEASRGGRGLACRSSDRAGCILNHYSISQVPSEFLIPILGSRTARIQQKQVGTLSWLTAYEKPSQTSELCFFRGSPSSVHGPCLFSLYLLSMSLHVAPGPDARGNPSFFLFPQRRDNPRAVAVRTNTQNFLVLVSPRQGEGLKAAGSGPLQSV